MNGYDQNSCRDSVAKTLKLVYFVRTSRLFSSSISTARFSAEMLEPCDKIVVFPFSAYHQQNNFKQIDDIAWNVIRIGRLENENKTFGLFTLSLGVQRSVSSSFQMIRMSSMHRKIKENVLKTMPARQYSLLVTKWIVYCLPLSFANPIRSSTHVAVMPNDTECELK